MQLKKSKMNKKTLFSFLAIALFTTFSFAQNRALPNKEVKTLDQTLRIVILMEEMELY